jgi:hypothetical protein
MLRPDNNDFEGKTKHLPAIVEEPVRRFFEEERAAFGSDPGARDIRRVRRLPEACGEPFEIKVFDRPFDRTGYFEGVAGLVPSLQKPALVFLDPDTGMGQATGRQSKHKQIRPAEVGLVFAALRPRDILTLFQYRWRRADWVKSLTAMFEAALAGSKAQIAVDKDLALFSAVKQ